MVLLDAPKSQRQTTVLFPEPKRRIGLRLDTGAEEEGPSDDIPTILMGFTEIEIREVADPVLLVRAIADECEISAPMSEVENEMEVQALAASINHLVPS